MKKVILTWGLSLLMFFIVAGGASASLVRFDFSGNLGDGSQNGNTSFGTIAAGTAFSGYVLYDTDAVGNQTGTPEKGWDKMEYAFVSFYLTIGGETFSMTGNAPDDENASPYGAINITDFPNTDQFFVKIYGKKNGADFPASYTLGGKELKSIQMAFSGKDLLNGYGTGLMDAETLQNRYEASSRAVMSLVGTDYYTVSSNIKEAQASNVPIPGAVWLLGTGLLGLVAVRRRRRH